ncbi:hypothetical protein IV203_026512 [Nitzschia inconspicua]|uniref:Uncharacterized protein n=1 Tax=Nitzschia inconspicua TaxID=303405 RepID=A0A9K3LJD7_9STRA|nr:hypothetical protein IV203_026512 [Nitzschia inconspicua]
MSSPGHFSATVLLEEDEHSERNSADMNGNGIPEAPAVLLENANDTLGPARVQQTQYEYNNSSCDSNNTNINSPYSQYASARILGSEATLSSRALGATTTYAEAVPLDPWFKPQTTDFSPNTTAGRIHDNNTFIDSQQQIMVVTETEQSDESGNRFRDHRQRMMRYRLLAAIREDPLDRKRRRRRRRRVRMVAGGVTGFVFGTFVLGPIGGVAGATAGAALARTASKIGEKRKDGRVERERDRLETEQQQEQYDGVRHGDSTTDSYNNNFPRIQEAYATSDLEERGYSR